jgi:uncharacterized Zn finger protein (UPF0148 family)
MSMQSMQCPSCGAGLEGTQGQAHVVCRFCGTESKLSITPVESVQRHYQKKEQVQSTMDRLMERYAELLGRGHREAALPYYEAFTYLVMWTAQEVEDLSVLEPMITPMMRDAARQLGIAYRAPAERGEAVTFASVQRLLQPS